MNKIKLNNKKLNQMIENTKQYGGFSDKVLLEKRYIVSMELDQEVIIPLEKFNIKSLKNSIKNFTLKLNQGIGTWLHNEQVFVDINQGFNNLEEALSIARKNNQLAIYDTLENKEILTGIVR